MAYVEDLKEYLEIFEERLDKSADFGDVSNFKIEDGESATNPSIVVSFQIGDYKLSYNIIINNKNFLISASGNEKPILSYDASKDYDVTYDVLKDGDYLLRIMEYALLRYFDKPITNKYESLEYNENVVIMEKRKMLIGKKYRLILEKSITDATKKNEVRHILAEMYTYFMKKTLPSGEYEEEFVIETVDKLSKKDEFKPREETNYYSIKSSLNMVILETIFENVTKTYGYKKDEIMAEFEAQFTPTEQMRLINEMNVTFTELLSHVFFGSEASDEVVEIEDK